jgi:hypothetical protein
MGAGAAQASLCFSAPCVSKKTKVIFSKIEILRVVTVKLFKNHNAFRSLIIASTL